MFSKSSAAEASERVCMWEKVEYFILIVNSCLAGVHFHQKTFSKSDGSSEIFFLKKIARQKYNLMDQMMFDQFL